MNPRPTAGGKTLWTLAGVSLLLQVPFLRRGISLMDEGSMLAIGDALRQGEVLYRDRATNLGPLAYELMGMIFRWFGPSLLAARLLQMLLFTVCLLLTWRLLERACGRGAAFAGGVSLLALKGLAFRTWTMANYSQVALCLDLASTLLVLSFLEDRRLRWLVLAGAGTGLTLLTKQNLGVVTGFVFAIVLLVDWSRGPERRFASLAQIVGSSLAGGLLPCGITFVRYALSGAAGPFLDQTVWRQLAQRGSYWVPPPGLDLWFLRADGPGMDAFTYFPAPFFNLAWEGDLPFSSAVFVLSVELLVKAAYYVPVLCFAAGVVQVARSVAAREARESWNARALLIGVGGGAYVSMLHRADWAHLMNFYPAVLVLCIAVLAAGPGRSRWAGRIGVGLLGLWLAAGCGAAAAVLAVYRVPVDSDRGRLLGTPSRADEAARVLEYLRRQPVEAPILVLRGEPLYYFLTGRRIPIRFDVLIPGLVTGEDDREVASALRDVDQVIYNPKETSLLPRPIADYAPRTAEALAEEFHVDRVLGPTAVVLKRRQEAVAPGLVVEDLWERWEGTAAGGEAGRGSWAFYRVIEAWPRGPDRRSCVRFPHDTGPEEMISVLPLFHPSTWDAASGGPGGRAVFQVGVREGRRNVILRAEERARGRPGDPLRVPLDRFAGRRVELWFCVTLPPAGAGGRHRARVGWGEPKVIRAPDGR